MPSKKKAGRNRKEAKWQNKLTREADKRKEEAETEEAETEADLSKMLKRAANMVRMEKAAEAAEAVLAEQNALSEDDEDGKREGMSSSTWVSTVRVYVWEYVCTRMCARGCVCVCI